MKAPSLFALGFLVAITLPASAQKEQPSSPESGDTASAAPTAISIQQAVLEAALTYKDRAVATQAAVRLIHLDSKNSDSWKSTLVSLYQGQGMIASAFTVSQELYATAQQGKLTNVNSNAVRQVHAFLLETVGQKDAARTTWQELFNAAPNTQISIKLAGLQLEAELIEEGLQTVDSGLSLIAAMDQEVAHHTTISVPLNREKMQEIPVKAVLMNLKGALLSRKTPVDLEETTAAYRAALKISPEFEIAQRNLDSMAIKTPEK